MARRLVLLAAVVLGGAGSAHGATGTLVFFSRRTPDGGLYAESSSGGTLRLLRTGTVSSSGATWAPDGRHYVFETQGDPSWTSDLWIADADGRHTRLVARNAFSVSWAPDGRRIAFVRNGAIWTVRSDGTGERRVIAPQDPGGFVGDPSWSPDGRRIAFRSQGPPGGADDSALMLVPATGGTARLLAQCVYWRAGWSPKGDRIAFDSCGPQGRDVAAAGIYTLDLRTGARRRVAPDGNGAVSWSPDGKWIAFFYDGSPAELSIVRPNGRDLRQLDPAGIAFDIPWSPGSRRLAFTYGYPSDVWVVGTDGHTFRVTQGWRYGYWNSNPSWAPRNVTPARLGGEVVTPAIPTDSVVVDGTLESARLVESVSADGQRVAIAYGPGPSPGQVIETWDAPAGAIVRFDEHGWQPPALAGDRLALPEFEHAAGVNFYEIALSTVDRPNALAVTGLCREGDGPPGGLCIRPPVADVAGHGSLLVFDGWKGLEPYCNLPCPPPKRDGILFRIDDGAAVQIATSDAELTPLAVDAGRILVNAGGGTLAVLDANGKTLVTVPAPAFTEAKLQGADLVAHDGVTLDDYDSTSGALLHEWPIPADATLQDVQSGVAVYVTSTDVHLLRLADGHEDVVTPPGSGPLHAQLEPGALFYSYAVAGAMRPGRVAFVTRP